MIEGIKVWLEIEGRKGVGAAGGSQELYIQWYIKRWKAYYSILPVRMVGQLNDWHEMWGAKLQQSTLKLKSIFSCKTQSFAYVFFIQELCGTLDVDIIKPQGKYNFQLSTHVGETIDLQCIIPHCTITHTQVSIFEKTNKWLAEYGIICYGKVATSTFCKQYREKQQSTTSFWPYF